MLVTNILKVLNGERTIVMDTRRLEKAIYKPTNCSTSTKGKPEVDKHSGQDETYLSCLKTVFFVNMTALCSDLIIVQR